MGRGTTPHSCRALVAVPHQNFSRTSTNHFLQPRWTKFSSSLWSQITLSLIIVYYNFFFFFLTVWELNMMQKATSVGMVFTSWQLGPAVKSQHLIGHPVAGIISQTFCSKLKFTYEQHYYLNNQPLTKPLTWPKLHHVVSLDKLYSE